MTNEYDIYEIEAEDWYRHDTRKVFDCECGSQRYVDKETECKQCGAWYVHRDGVMVQTASPIGGSDD